MKYSNLLFRGRKADNQKSIKTISWSDKIVDPSNYWLKAVNKEEEHEYEIAADSYLKDAIASFDKGSFNRAALSCSCAATCVSKLGDRKTAQKLFFEAGNLFETKANTVSSESIRDSVWALRQSYENFIMSGDVQKAEEIYQTIITYASRINPLSGSQELRLMNGESQMMLENMKYDSEELKADIGSKTGLFATIQEFMSMRSEKAAHNEVK